MSSTVGTGQVIATTLIVEKVHQAQQNLFDNQQKAISKDQEEKSAKNRSRIEESEEQDKVTIRKEEQKEKERRKFKNRKDDQEEKKKQNDESPDLIPVKRIDVIA